MNDKFLDGEIPPVYNCRCVIETYVDSSNEPYLRSLRESIAQGWGLICKDNPFGYRFVTYAQGIEITPDDYPLYSRDKGVN